MVENNGIRRRKWAAQVLDSDLTPLNKVRKLVALGYDEEAANNLVERASVGSRQMVYYEQLPTPEYRDEL